MKALACLPSTMSMFRSMSMCVVVCFLLLLVSLLPQSDSKPVPLSSPYLSPTTILNYRKMVQSFKVFMYKPNKPEFNFTTPVESLFYTSLQSSPFLTQNPEEAHLFFVPFSPHITTRSLARFIGRLRTELPYWNRTLGADHFYLSCAGIGHESDRNIVELKKNSVQISCFPAQNGKFIPHKDVTLPPISSSHAPHQPANGTARFLGYVRRGDAITKPKTTLVNEMVNDPEFVIESEPSDSGAHAERLGSSKFCLVEYGNENDVSYIEEALRFGCLPVVITERPVNDLPFMDVLRWGEMAVFVRREGGVKELKRVLDDTWRDRQEYMRGLGVVASQHLLWNQPPLPFDAFNTLMYQLWMRRHTIRYTNMGYE